MRGMVARFRYAGNMTMSRRGSDSEKRCDENGFEVPLYGACEGAKRGPGSPRPGGPTGRRGRTMVRSAGTRDELM